MKTAIAPAMKKAGYPPEYAAAIETCASTGGVLMPPIMGATAFLISEFLGISYIKVCIAAAIPSLLFYFGLFVQVDAVAVRKKIKGIDKNELPPKLEVLKQGWFYIATFAVLVFPLFYLTVFPWLD